MYCSCHDSYPIPFTVIQFPSCIWATTISAQARRWQTKRFFMITPKSCQYLSNCDALMNLSYNLWTCSIRCHRPTQGPMKRMCPSYTSMQLSPTETTASTRAHNWKTILIFFLLRKASNFSWLRFPSASHFSCMV